MAAAVGLPPYLGDEIRTYVQTNRVRIDQFFQDYDKLRSGFVTGDQFLRCLWQTMNLKLDKEQERALLAQYDTKCNGMANYRRFCEDIKMQFLANDVWTPPEQQKSEPLELLGTTRSMQPLTKNNEDTLVHLLRRMNHFYGVHGLNLRTNYADFDVHHMGLVTESQFYRNYPGPSDTSEEEMDLLVQKYRDPQRPGMVNYLNLHHDIMAVSDYVNFENSVPTIKQTDIDSLPPQLTTDLALNTIFEKLKVAVFKNGIRSLEFFRDYDKLRSGLVTENQFVAGLTLAAGKEAQLTQSEVQKIVEFYRQDIHRVKYKDLCDMLENAFNVAQLEKKPLDIVDRPVTGTLFRGLKDLNSEHDEMRLQIVLETLRDFCRRRRVLMYPYFKDYDRSSAYSRVVTPLQFGRILHFVGMNVAPEDFKLLVGKFQDPVSGDVDYPAFVQAVDSEFKAHTTDEVPVYDANRTNKQIEIQFPETEVTLDELMARIRHIVLTNRIRVLDHFQDFDTLRSGSMSKARFRRCLSTLSLSKIGHHDLNNSQFKLLCDAYQDPKKEDQVLYSKFVEDVESVFTVPNLEQTPSIAVPPQEIFEVPKPGTVDWVQANPNHVDLYEDTMARIRKRVIDRGILLRPSFKAFDKHNNGHVSQRQFRQALTMLDIPLSAPEMAAMEARFCNDAGVDYVSWLDHLEPNPPPEAMYVKRLEEVRLTNELNRLPEMDPCTDLESILLKIKTKVARERIRVEDFMRDYDKLRSGRMQKTSFRRAVTLARLDLYESEMATVEDKYQSAGYPDYVDYKRFCDEIESIFTIQQLEKKPLEEPEQFKVPTEWEMNKLTPGQTEKFMRCMTKIKEKVRKHRMQLFPLFEDYDKVNIGSVTQQQFRRVLTALDLEHMVGHEEFLLLCQQFRVKVGLRDDVNYIAFSEMVYHMAGFEWRKP